MKKYNKLNNIVGWVVFLVAAIVYIITSEPTTSFWDCGEFITSAYKLEVGHPPGAPFFMIIGRFFTLFAPDVTYVARMINTLSALVSAFTILFLFWTITHITRRIIAKNNEITDAKIITILGSGFVGALAYTFSDTFWFSAVEGEVYAMSSFFTAVVFWAILKWESIANESFANRWIILIAYLMGLSIGVHLLNLLAIPAIVMIYYFKKHKPTTKGVLTALGISVLILGFVMYGIVQGLFILGSKFELLFVNGFGMPYFSGVLFYVVLILGLLAFGLYYTYQKRKVLANTILLVSTVIVIGYSSFALILIRSLADTPMDQNNPENIFDLLAYLNREQYGDRPLVKGHYFNAPLREIKQGKPIYIQKNGKYEIAQYRQEYIYDDDYVSIFPRMYSEQQSSADAERGHPMGYFKWAGIKGKPSELKRKPTFAENLKFFFKYQVNFMYVRYFMWNFVGRQNDIQGDGLAYGNGENGDVLNGNWISGIKFIDEARLGKHDTLPVEQKNNPARNTYYFLPLILGIIGAVFTYKYHKQYFWVVTLLFIFTGLAIVVYLNQPPFQPRERDYAYVGSFYAFAIFIGLGVAGVAELLRKAANRKIAGIVATSVCFLGVPVLLAAQNWDDHDRSGRFTARDFAYNYLNSCNENAIIFTNGDNDTFPLWYAQEVEGIRTDVRVVNLSYFSTDWYINQMRHRAYESAPIDFTLTPEKYVPGQREVIYNADMKGIYFNQRYKANIDKLKPAYTALYDSLLTILSNSKFPQLMSSDFEKLKTDRANIEPEQIIGLIMKVTSEQNIKKIELSTADIVKLKNYTEQFTKTVGETFLPIDLWIEFVADDSDNTKRQTNDGKMRNVMPDNKLLIPVDRAKVVADSILPKHLQGRMLSKIEWNMGRSGIHKNNLAVIDLISTNIWKRPIYYAITVGPDNYLNLQSNFLLEGLAYRLAPIYSPRDEYGQTGLVNTDKMYDNMMNKFRWGGIDNPDVYLDENNRRMVMNLRNNFARLAKQLALEGKNEKAIEVLDKCGELLPNERIPFNYYNLFTAEAYFRAGATEKGNAEVAQMVENILTNLDYYLSLTPEFSEAFDRDTRRELSIIQEAFRVLKSNGQDEKQEELNLKLEQLLKTKRISIQ